MAVAAMAANIFAPTAAALGREELIALKAENEVCIGDTFRVTVETLSEGAVSNGKLVVEYDPDIISYESEETGTAWADGDAVVCSVNDRVDGRLVLAFTGDRPAGVGVIFTLEFSTLSAGQTEVELGRESYIGGSVSVSAGAAVGACSGGRTRM